MAQTQSKAAGTGRNGGSRKRAERLGPEVRRPLILDAAYDVFLENGYDGASMSTIAERAGVTKPVIYDSFANKDELFDALRDRERDRIMSAATAAMPEAPHIQLEETVIAGLGAFLEYVRAEPEAFRMIVLGEGASGEASLRIQSRRSEFIETVAAIIDDWGREPGERPSTGVELIAHTLVGAAEGIARAIMAEPDRYDPQISATLVARFLVRGGASL